MSAARPAPPPRDASDTDLLEPIRDISHTIVQRLAPQLIAANLAPSTFWPLHHLDQGTERHPGELARRLGVTPATCTASIDHLVERGFVVRRSSERDRRQIVLVVTPKGHRTLETIWQRFDASLREALAAVPPEDVAVTSRTLRALASELRRELAAEEAGP
ncbi:MAG TPA: MarR family transcriptional regulator [Thermoplasmata archaeon]|nr:MarR family transcriptional regulator [Thermoplasmata archaeon]